MNNEIYGWTGKMLRVDLSRGKIRVLDSRPYTGKFIGGKGLNHRLAWDELKPGTKAFDADNCLFISVGPLTGTPAPNSGRATIGGISAQSLPEMYAHSGVGGWFPPALKYAGFDALIITGRSPFPCYLYIENGKAHIKKAVTLWGLGTYDTQKELKRIHGPEVRSLCIGPAGENRSRIAVLLTDTENAAGQGGYGGVAGSKNLKAICVKGTGNVRIARPDMLLKLRKKNMPKKEDTPIIDNGKWVYDKQIIQSVPYRRHKVSCSHSCDRHCFWSFHDVPRVTRPGIHSGKWGCVGQEVVGWQAPMKVKWPLWRQGVKAGFEITELFNQYGLNAWDLLAGIVPWLVMADREDVLSQKDFKEIYPIDADNPEWWVNLVKIITFRKGAIGDLLAEGTTRAIEHLGIKKYGDTIYRGYEKKIPTKISLQAAWGYAGHWSGRGIHSALKFPCYLVQALTWLTASRDPMDDTHIRMTKKEEDELNKNQYSGETAPRIAIWNEHRSELKSSLTLCDWAFPRLENTALESQLFSAVTGIDYSEQKLDRIGERIKNMQRALLVRNYDRDFEQEFNAIMPWFERPDGTRAISVDRDKFKGTVETYYKMRGWDKRGRPTKETLDSLELNDIADELVSRG